MAIKFEKIKPGMIVFQRHRIRRETWQVKIIEVDQSLRRAFVSWNGNTPAWISERRLSKYFLTPQKQPEK